MSLIVALNRTTFAKCSTIDPSMLKPKKQKTDSESQSTTTTPASINLPTSSGLLNSRQELNKTPQSSSKKRQGSKSPATVTQPQSHASENKHAPAPMVSYIKYID